ncbi:hypothetical protein DSUL_20008 [Desulfovibrionales bacterium]
MKRITDILSLCSINGTVPFASPSGEIDGNPNLQRDNATDLAYIPEFDRILHYHPTLATTVYARDGRILSYLYKEKRFLMPLSEMSRWLPKAFLAAEDSAFYDHKGIDLTAIFRAIGKNVTAGDAVQGGSTITQQVVKRLILTPKKSFLVNLKRPF